MEKRDRCIVRESSSFDPLDCRPVERDRVDLLAGEGVCCDLLDSPVLKADRLEGGGEGSGQQGGQGGVDDLDGDGGQVSAHPQLEGMLLQLQPGNVGRSEASQTGEGTSTNNSSFDVSQLELDNWTVLDAGLERLRLERD